MKRISVTTIEKFRRYLAEVSPFDTEENLIQSILGIFKGNDKTMFGEAYHQLIEGKFSSEKDGFGVGDFLFTAAQIRPAIEYKRSHQSMIHEVSISKIYHTKHGPIQVTGRADGIEGIQIRDPKTKFRSFNVQEYMDSLQWRFYLDMMEMDSFFFDVFKVNGFDGLPAVKPYRLTDVRVEDPVEIRCDWYYNIPFELEALLNLFISYLHQRNLFNSLKPALEQTIPFQ